MSDFPEYHAGPVLFVPRGSNKIDEYSLKIAGEAIEAAERMKACEKSTREVKIRLMHDDEFRGFRNKFYFEKNEKEDFAISYLFRNRAELASIDDLSPALEYVSRYNNLLPPQIWNMRFYQILRHFDLSAAAEFSEVSKVGPDLDAETVFRKIARNHKLYRYHSTISTPECIRFFNHSAIIDGMEAFEIQNYIGLRQIGTNSMVRYADLMVPTSDFTMLAVSIFMDHRREVVELIKSGGAQGSLCHVLIREYIDGVDMEQGVVAERLRSVMRGQPAFVSTPSILVTAKRPGTGSIFELKHQNKASDSSGPTRAPLAETNVTA